MFNNVNFAQIARDMGCIGIRVERPEQISEALNTSLSAKLPVVVEVITDVECKAPDAWGGQDPV
jgi:acetolactate synthase-1/2/3 large subunit